MAVTAAVSAYSTYLERGANTIAEVRSIVGPKVTLATVDASNLLSPNTFMEFIGGMLDGGEVTIEGSFYPGDTNGQIGLRDDQLARTIQDFTITFPTSTGTVWTFKGLVTSFETGAILDDRLTFACTIKVTAKPALGVTASADMTVWAGIEENGLAALTIVPTPFAAATYEYSCDPINTASTWAKMTCTHGTAVITVFNSFNDSTVTLLTTVQSEPMLLGAADSLTTLTVTVKDALKAPVSYIFRIVRP